MPAEFASAGEASREDSIGSEEIMTGIQQALIVLATAAGCSICVQASTLTYVFSEAGFSDTAGNTGILNGTFTGTPESNGILQLADLTTFGATFVETVNGTPENFVFNTPTDFFFDPNIAGSLNFSTGSTLSGIVLCSGSTDTGAVCFGLGPHSGGATSALGFFEDLPNFGPSTTRLPASVTAAGAPSAVPEPGTCVLLLTGCLVMFVMPFCRCVSRRRLRYGGLPHSGPARFQPPPRA